MNDMTQDDLYQVIYECSECGHRLAIDDTSLRAISKQFELLGWLNEEQGPGNYVVTCPECYAEWVQEQNYMSEWKEIEEELATQDDFLAGTGRW